MDVGIATFVERATILQEWNDHVMFKKMTNDKEVYDVHTFSFGGCAS